MQPSQRHCELLISMLERWAARVKRLPRLRFHRGMAPRDGTQLITASFAYRSFAYAGSAGSAAGTAGVGCSNAARRSREDCSSVSSPEVPELCNSSGSSAMMHDRSLFAEWKLTTTGLLRPRRMHMQNISLSTSRCKRAVSFVSLLFQLS